MTSACVETESSCVAGPPFGLTADGCRAPDPDEIRELTRLLTAPNARGGGLPLPTFAAPLSGGLPPDPWVPALLRGLVEHRPPMQWDALVWDGAPPAASPVPGVVPAPLSTPGLVGPDGEPLTPESPAGSRLAVAFQSVNARVLTACRERPELLREMPWRAFEELIAELFRRDGFDVELTPPSGDRGVDLRAARHTHLGSLLYVVECKRHRHDRPISPKLVRELRGVIDRERANVGVLVTTSYFTDAALREHQSLSHRMSLRAFADVVDWLGGRPIF